MGTVVEVRVDLVVIDIIEVDMDIMVMKETDGMEVEIMMTEVTMEMGSKKMELEMAFLEKLVVFV